MVVMDFHIGNAGHRYRSFAGRIEGVHLVESLIDEAAVHLELLGY